MRLYDEIPGRPGYGAIYISGIELDCIHGRLSRETMLAVARRYGLASIETMFADPGVYDGILVMGEINPCFLDDEP